jgi:DGQHR domain-containing protein
MNALPLEEVPQQKTFPCLQVVQPLGTFYVAVIDARTLTQITSSDVRRMTSERPFETYLGIQRPLDRKRVDALEKYVNTADACFPTSIVLAVDAKCAEFDQMTSAITLKNYIPEADDRPIYWIEVARVLDGQHRIEGLKALSSDVPFGINVCIFVDLDIEDQAYVFSTVNLTQTKVSKSLAYDLFDLAKTRSPQKTCHNLAVALDGTEKSPFFRRIKRLGLATPGRLGETLSQATFVEALIPYLSADPVADRDLYLRGRKPARVHGKDNEALIFRNMFIDEKDLEILDIVWNYFSAVRERWPLAWDAGGKGLILNKTNGFRALMRLLKPAYLHVAKPGEVPTQQNFAAIFAKSPMKDEEFNVDTFKPGTSGEALLFRTLEMQCNL